MVRICLAMCILVSIILAFVDAAYKKPPFNGSIFGKRGSTIIEYENAGKALSSLCEIASEACSAWFPLPDN
ncbi:SIFamide-related peptide [Nilaparvata lugens]|uniref:SIFamide n=2 Tax=Delphacidae TaxID=33362 RepID=A0A345BEF2_LAOST|nr:SIFamide-related peptide [Nilaparvata lugens]XP_039298407.1 SIFamide-related peptide [Nilaparvata lugens]AXF48204.1 SIFamide [Laodelphax striatellus]BAO00977.1 SIFamide [Nilaparvata lugens]